ncbi:hypothetical protein LXL04_007974 [Taraxacum kok-saghyz]
MSDRGGGGGFELLVGCWVETKKTGGRDPRSPISIGPSKTDPYLIPSPQELIPIYFTPLRKDSYLFSTLGPPIFVAFTVNMFERFPNLTESNQDEFDGIRVVTADDLELELPVLIFLKLELELPTPLPYSDFDITVRESPTLATYKWLPTKIVVEAVKPSSQKVNKSSKEPTYG